MLIVELDGGQHADQLAYDQHRTKWLEAQGFQVVRFWNNEVLTNMDGAYTSLMQNLSLRIGINNTINTARSSKSI